VQRLHEFSDALAKIFGTDFAAGKKAIASKQKPFSSPKIPLKNDTRHPTPDTRHPILMGWNLSKIRM